MKFTIPTAPFLEAASNAAAVAAAKSPKRILECVAIRADKKSGVLLEATDLDVAVRIRLADAKVSTEGAVVVPAARFVSVLREVPEKEVTLATADGRLEIDTADCRFRINGEEPQEFPVLPDFPAAGVLSLECGVLRGMIRRTSFATAKEPGRYALHGVLFRVSGGTLELVATDGRRLARATHALGSTTAGDVKLIVGAKGLSLLDRLAADDTAKVDVALEERQILFRSGGVVLSSRLIDGTFPSYEEVIPKPSKRGFGVPAGDFAMALRRAALLTAREAQSVQMDVAPQKLTISSRASDVGEAKVDLKIPYEEAPERLGFNPGYLIDALKVMDPAHPVRFEFTTPKSPGKLTDGDDYVYVVMPVAVE
jgi:DNA polymerase-3 subunit beta